MTDRVRELRDALAHKVDGAVRKEYLNAMLCSHVRKEKYLMDAEYHNAIDLLNISEMLRRVFENKLPSLLDDYERLVEALKDEHPNITCRDRKERGEECLQCAVLDSLTPQPADSPPVTQNCGNTAPHGPHSWVAQLGEPEEASRRCETRWCDGADSPKAFKERLDASMERNKPILDELRKDD